MQQITSKYELLSPLGFDECLSELGELNKLYASISLEFSASTMQGTAYITLRAKPALRGTMNFYLIGDLRRISSTSTRVVITKIEPIWPSYSLIMGFGTVGCIVSFLLLIVTGSVFAIVLGASCLGFIVLGPLAKTYDQNELMRIVKRALNVL